MSGRIAVPCDNVRSCADVSALILWRLSSPTGTAREVSPHLPADVRMEDAMRDRLTDLDRVSSHMLELLDDIVLREAMPPPHASVDIVVDNWQAGRRGGAARRRLFLLDDGGSPGPPATRLCEEYCDPRMTPDTADESDDVESNRDDPDSDASNNSEHSSSS